MKKVIFILLNILLLNISLFALSSKEIELLDAVKRGDYDTVVEIMEEEKIRPVIYDESGQSLLHIAVANGNYKIVSALLKKKNPFIPTDRFLSALPVVALIAIIFLVLSFLFGIIYSHKLAGPIYRIEKSVLQLINGSRDFKIKLRKGDEFQKLAETINRLIEYLNENSKILKEVKVLMLEYEKNPQPELLKEIQTKLNMALEEIE